ncbi:MAG: cytochrome b/b6 domain-containing protein [bacterium]
MKDEIKVWDPLVRIFHWSLVIGFIGAYATGDEENMAHIYLGYWVMGLIIFRLIWGLIGTKYARFSNFLYSPVVVFKYLRGLLSGESKRYIGHNPAGSWMVMVILVTLVVVTYSGLKVYAIEEGAGPLAEGRLPSVELVATARADRDEDDDHYYERHGAYGEEYEEDAEEEFWEEIHEASSNFMVFLIILHVIGVFTSSAMHDESLVRAMITGRKKN